jgi:hypothetical protein
MLDANFVNATELCIKNNKQSYEFFRLNDTKKLLKELSSKLAVPENKLCIRKRGKGGSTYIHLDILPELERWLRKDSYGTYPEKSCKEEFVKTLPKNYKTEVACAAGLVDVVTPKEVIEIKAMRSWKAAIGQILVYRLYFPTKSPRIHLFGDDRNTDVKVIKEVCQTLGVKVTFH